jgi:hypothetical protein
LLSPEINFGKGKKSVKEQNALCIVIWRDKAKEFMKY